LWIYGFLYSTWKDKSRSLGAKFGLSAYLFVESPSSLFVQVATAVYAAYPRNEVMRLAPGIGPWRINQRFRVLDGLTRSERSRPKCRAGCLRGSWNARRIRSYAAGIRVAWLHGSLFNIATTLPGDRSAVGFTVGTARVLSVRARDPGPASEHRPWAGFSAAGPLQARPAGAGCEEADRAPGVGQSPVLVQPEGTSRRAGNRHASLLGTSLVRQTPSRRLKSAKPAWLAGLALVLLVTASGASSGFLAQTSCLTALEPQVGTAASGDVVVLWRCEDGVDRLQAAYRGAASGIWSRLDDIRPAPAEAPVHLGSPALGVDGPGDAAAAWGVLSGYEGGKIKNRLVQAAVRPAGAAWSPGETLSATDKAAEAPQIAVGPGGEAVAVWTATDANCYSGCRWKVQAAVRPAASGDWGKPQDLSAASSHLGAARVALDAGGNALVVWADGPLLQSAARPTGAVDWSAPQLISDEGVRGPAEAPRLALDGAGNALVIWGHRTPADSEPVSVRAALRPAATGAWAAQDLPGTSDLRPVLQVALSVNAAGDAAAVWRRGTDGFGPVVIEASLRGAASGSWTPPQRLSEVRFRDGLPPLDYLPGAPGVALDGSGDAVAVWQEPVHTEYATCSEAPCLSSVLAAVRPAATGIWGSPTRWGAGGTQVAAEPGGTAIAVWSGYEMHTIRCAERPCLIVQAAVRPLASETWGQPTYLSAPPPPLPLCVVPRVVGKPLAQAKAAVRRGHCTLGKVSYARSRKVRRGRVLAQRPKAGARLRRGARVNLIVSSGRERW
jgi:PASTA domain